MEQLKKGELCQNNESEKKSRETIKIKWLPVSLTPNAKTLQIKKKKNGLDKSNSSSSSDDDDDDDGSNSQLNFSSLMET